MKPNTGLRKKIRGAQQMLVLRLDSLYTNPKTGTLKKDDTVSHLVCVEMSK